MGLIRPVVEHSRVYKRKAAAIRESRRICARTVRFRAATRRQRIARFLRRPACSEIREALRLGEGITMFRHSIIQDRERRRSRWPHSDGTLLLAVESFERFRARGRYSVLRGKRYGTCRGMSNADSCRRHRNRAGQLQLSKYDLHGGRHGASSRPAPSCWAAIRPDCAARNIEAGNTLIDDSSPDGTMAEFFFGDFTVEGLTFAVATDVRLAIP